MNYAKRIAFYFFIFIIQNIFAQSDTLISYNPATNETDLYPSVFIDSSKLFDNTQWYFGTEPGFDYLDLTPPDSTYNGSGFSDLVPVHKIYSASNYPARTAVKIFFQENDTLKQRCSGILVARNYVLTDCHCVGVFDAGGKLIFLDSLWAFVAYDGGEANPTFGKSIATEYVTFKSNLQGFYSKDIALVKLKENLGIKAGWVGIAFSKDDGYFADRVFYKFSYPGETDPFDSSRVFNGDTLYFNYGELDVIDDGWLGYYISGIPGQSGSALLYTDNVKYYSFGTHVWTINSRHLRITPEIFYPFKSVLNNGISTVENNETSVDKFQLSEAYPNPFSKSARFGNSLIRINYTMPTDGFVRLIVYDVLGRTVKTLVNRFNSAGKYEAAFSPERFPNGIYFLRMESGNFSTTKKIVVLN
ncbi:MAG: T9SS type A sorting domain-containing protein [Chlorobi bacterium]|nr:T9SS type A sorting domain-containing protein [Chlorobiota bacterium]